VPLSVRTSCLLDHGVGGNPCSGLVKANKNRLNGVAKRSWRGACWHGLAACGAKGVCVSMCMCPLAAWTSELRPRAPRRCCVVAPGATRAGHPGPRCLCGGPLFPRCAPPRVPLQPPRQLQRPIESKLPWAVMGEGLAWGLLAGMELAACGVIHSAVPYRRI
jgi:hypothetical protein